MNNSVDTDLPSASQTSDLLAEVALNLRWSWNHAADQLWERLDPELRDLTHNPWFVLQTVSREKLRSVTSDPGFQKLAKEIVEKDLQAITLLGSSLIRLEPPCLWRPRSSAGVTTTYKLGQPGRPPRRCSKVSVETTQIS